MPDASARETEGMMAATMFERYGGFATVSKLVLAFYDRVLESDILADFFAGVEMRRLVDHQTKFISSLMGGPASYTNESLKQVHAHLGIGKKAFEEMILTLTETLEDFELDEQDIESIILEMRAREPFIVTRAD